MARASFSSAVRLAIVFARLSAFERRPRLVDFWTASIFARRSRLYLGKRPWRSLRESMAEHRMERSSLESVREIALERDISSKPFRLLWIVGRKPESLAECSRCREHSTLDSGFYRPSNARRSSFERPAAFIFSICSFAFSCGDLAERVPNLE